jgi:hypothetical protein
MLLVASINSPTIANAQTDSSPPTSIQKPTDQLSTPLPSTPPDKSTTLTGQSKSEGASGLWQLATLLLLPLHIVEIWGIIQLFLSFKKIQRDQEKNSKNLKDENKKFTDDLQELTKKIQVRDTKIKQIEKDLAKANGVSVSKPVSLFPESTPNPSFIESPANEFTTPEELPASNYPFLDLYNRNPDSFAQHYTLVVVSEDANNINDRRSGDSNDIILSESRNGNYWLVKVADTTYLIPRPKVKIQEHNIRTVKGLFDCSTFDPDYQGFTVIQPAIVSVQSLADGLKWKVELKGELKFT